VPDEALLASDRRSPGDGLPTITEWKPPKVRGPMTEELFWKLIDTSRRGLEVPDEQRDRLVRLLEQLPEADIVAFDRLLQARMSETYRWDLWAVAYIANGGCSDDGFEYFCAWLVAQGQKYWEAALADPAAAAKRIVPGEPAEFELMLAVAEDAWEARGGEGDFRELAGPVARPEPRGEQWEEDELPRLYPKLAKRFGLPAGA
jgi:hypothetical protein